jgi:hypothetical protein
MVADGPLHYPRAFSPHGGTLACGCTYEGNAGVVVWDLASGKERSRVVFDQEQRGCHALAESGTFPGPSLKPASLAWRDCPRIRGPVPR